MIAGKIEDAMKTVADDGNRPMERLTDIVRNCDRILEYAADRDLDVSMAAPQMVRDAVERCFQRISEAVRKLEGVLDFSRTPLKLVPKHGFEPWTY